MIKATDRGVDCEPIYTLPMTVDYQDTDATGMVYHGNYLAFMERARNDCLRGMGFSLSELAQTTGSIFTLVRAELDFRQPAYLDDKLDVSIDAVKLTGVRLEFRQSIYRDSVALVRGRLLLVILNAVSFKPRKIPKVLTDAIAKLEMETDIRLSENCTSK